MTGLRTFVVVFAAAWLGFLGAVGLVIRPDQGTALIAAGAWLVLSLPIAGWLAFGERPTRAAAAIRRRF